MPESTRQLGNNREPRHCALSTPRPWRPSFRTIDLIQQISRTQVIGPENNKPVDGYVCLDAARCEARTARRALRSLSPDKPTSLLYRASLRDANRPPRIAGNHLPTRGIGVQVKVLHGNRTEENLVTKQHAPDEAFPISDL